MSLIKVVIVGTNDREALETLLTENSDLSCSTTCTLAKRCETVKGTLDQLASLNRDESQLNNILRRRESVKPSELESEPEENSHTGTDVQKAYQRAEEEQTEQNAVPSKNESAENAPLRRSTRLRQPIRRFSKR